MKKLKTLSRITQTLVSGLFLLEAAHSQEIGDLNGIWTGYGYECYDNQGRRISIPNESIRVHDLGTQIIGIKVIGDDCVTEGATTFIIDTIEKRFFDQSYNASLRGGNLQRPNSNWQTGRAHIVSPKEITIFFGSGSLTYIRENQ